jgi:hypothetical protein
VSFHPSIEDRQSLKPAQDRFLALTRAVVDRYPVAASALYLHTGCTPSEFWLSPHWGLPLLARQHEALFAKEGPLKSRDGHLSFQFSDPPEGAPKGVGLHAVVRRFPRTTALALALWGLSVHSVLRRLAPGWEARPHELLSHPLCSYSEAVWRINGARRPPWSPEVPMSEGPPPLPLSQALPVSEGPPPLPSSQALPMSEGPPPLPLPQGGGVTPPDEGAMTPEQQQRVLENIMAKIQENKAKKNVTFNEGAF